MTRDEGTSAPATSATNADAQALLERLCRQPSVAAQQGGIAEMADLIEAELRATGFTTDFAFCLDDFFLSVLATMRLRFNDLARFSGAEMMLPPHARRQFRHAQSARIVIQVCLTNSQFRPQKLWTFDKACFSSQSALSPAPSTR